MVADAFRPGHFYTGGGLELQWSHVAREEVAWEVFHGRLLDPAHTRAVATFETWQAGLVSPDPAPAEPLLSIKLDAGRAQVHVVRAVEVYAWEGYHAGDNVYLSRETRKWARELVGTIDVGTFADPAELRDELICLLFQAVVGTSRLPLTSVEAPLPVYTLGQLAYCYRPAPASVAAGPARSWREFLTRAPRDLLAAREQVKLLETVLRAATAEEVATAADRFADWWGARDGDTAGLDRLLRLLFDEVALSPWTEFVPRTLAFIRRLEEAGRLSAAQHADILGYVLRQLGRHLTAYDLVTFHHRGANYPDALLLDAALKAYFGLIRRRPGLFTGDDDRRRLRRRALRQAWLLRRRYEGHPVPDAPTSPGENVRVLPPPHVRVPDEQITDPARRTRRLFADDPLESYRGGAVGAALDAALADLEHPAELRELGTAVFLDRPLGAFKHPGEPDRTPLLACEAFSRSVAGRRLDLLRDLGLVADAARHAALRQRLQELPADGIARDPNPRPARPGSVSLADAGRVAADFVFVRTTTRTARELFAPFDPSPLAALGLDLEALITGRRVLVLSEPGRGDPAHPLLAVYDEQLRRRLDVQINGQGGYLCRAGVEYPADGLTVVRAWGLDRTTGGWQESRLGLLLPPTPRAVAAVQPSQPGKQE